MILAANCAPRIKTSDCRRLNPPDRISFERDGTRSGKVLCARSLPALPASHPKCKWRMGLPRTIGKSRRTHVLGIAGVARGGSAAARRGYGAWLWFSSRQPTRGRVVAFYERRKAGLL